MIINLSLGGEERRTESSGRHKTTCFSLCGFSARDRKTRKVRVWPRVVRRLLQPDCLVYEGVPSSFSILRQLRLAQGRCNRDFTCSFRLAFQFTWQRG